MNDVARIFVVATICLVCSNILGHELQGPKLNCKTPRYDFGTIDCHGVVKHTFILENTGNQPLHLDRVMACCGADVSLRTNSIAPGGRGEMDVVLSLAWRRGRVVKHIFIESSDAANRLFQLSITGNVESFADVSPPVIDFGMMKKTDSCETNILVTFSLSEELVNVTGLVSTIPSSVAEYRVLSKGRKYSVSVKISSLLYGVTKGSLQLLTDSSKYRIIEIPILVSVSKDLVIVPRELVLVAGGVDGGYSKRISLHSRSGKAFAVLGVDLPDDHMRFEISSNMFGGLRVTLNNVIPQRPLEGKNVIIHTDDKESEDIFIPIHILCPDAGAPKDLEGRQEADKDQTNSS